MVLPAMLFGALLAGGAQQQKGPSEYASLRDRVKSGDMSINFKRLRFSYIDSPEYQKAKGTDDQKKTMIEAINAHDFKKAIENAEIVLANDYSDMDAHFGEFIAYRETGDQKQAEFHQAVFNGLLNSVLDSGDGKSQETAFVVVSVHEEYVILRVLGLFPHEQALQSGHGHSYDVLDAEDPKTHKTVRLYFNVDASMNHLMKIFGPKK